MNNNRSTINHQHNKRKFSNMTNYKVTIQKDLKDTPFSVVSTILETTDKKVWWNKINEYRKTHWIHLDGTVATIET